MTSKQKIVGMAMIGGLFAATLASENNSGLSLIGGWVIGDAHAVFGRPFTPVSVAGVARRTTRRAIMASSIYVATLPAGCATVVIEDTTLMQCGTTYYMPAGDQYQVVYVDQ